MNNGPGKSICIFRDYANASGGKKSKLARKRFHIGTGRILTGDGQVIAFHKQGLGNGYETGDSTEVQPGTTPNASNNPTPKHQDSAQSNLLICCRHDSLTSCMNRFQQSQQRKHGIVGMHHQLSVYI